MGALLPTGPKKGKGNQPAGYKVNMHWPTKVNRVIPLPVVQRPVMFCRLTTGWLLDSVKREKSATECCTPPFPGIQKPQRVYSRGKEPLWHRGRTVRCARAVRALCEKLAVLHHREFGKFRRLKGRR